jgi:hypothetical protein
MMLSAWFFSAWFFLRGASAMRPSALQRMYSLIWLFVGGFALLVFTTVLAQNYQIAGSYYVMFYFAAIFLALLLSYIELFFLPSKGAYVARFDDNNSTRSYTDTPSRPQTGNTNNSRSEERPVLDDDATETTSLLRGDRRTFTRHGRRQSVSDGTEHEVQQVTSDLGDAYPGEQLWSAKMPSSIWILQFALLVPIVVTLLGQVALLTTSALHQTLADGNSSLLVYIVIAVLTTLLLAPIGPFIHRFTYHVPMFLFLVCIGTVIYNLVAFPFSRDHRLKVYFVQEVNLDTGENNVSLTGLDGYVQRIVKEIPSAQGQRINCTTPMLASRKELKSCVWHGLPAHVVPKQPKVAPFANRTRSNDWLAYNISKSTNTRNASIRVIGQNTRACRILFDTPILDVAVDGGVSDPRFNATGDAGSREVRLWHREWSQPWNVSVAWAQHTHTNNSSSSLSGRVVCLWSDANARGTIPAFDELQHYLPVWAVATKYSDGLVEGSKRFEI